MNGLTSSQGQMNTPKYVQVRDWLTRQISAGDMKEGSRLPSENQLVKEFGVSRVTVRHALDGLRKSGMVESRQGQGYFVRGLKAEFNFQRLQGLGEVLTANGVQTSARLLTRHEGPATGKIRKSLNLINGASVVVFERIRFADATPICYEERHIPNKFAYEFSDEEVEASDFCSLYENKLNVQIAFGDIMMELICVPLNVADILNIKSGSIVAKTEQVTYQTNGSAIDYCIRYALPGVFRYKSRMGRWDDEPEIV